MVNTKQSPGSSSLSEANIPMPWQQDLFRGMRKIEAYKQQYHKNVLQFKRENPDPKVYEEVYDSGLHVNDDDFFGSRPEVKAVRRKVAKPVRDGLVFEKRIHIRDMKFSPFPFSLMDAS